MMNHRPFIAAATLLGIGMGGFADGILFHQVLQLHSMLSAKLPQTDLINVKTSMVWDGFFHVFTWIATAAGLAMLWHAGKGKERPWEGKVLWGGLFMGWGIFNFVEGVIDHQILNIHHVVERMGLSVYDYLYIASGIIFILFGMLLIKAGKRKNITAKVA